MSAAGKAYCQEFDARDTSDTFALLYYRITGENPIYMRQWGRGGGRRRRDPVLVNICGPDQVLMQCFPVPHEGEMKIRIGIAFPLDIAANGMSARLPCPVIASRNFSVPSDLLGLPAPETFEGFSLVETPLAESEALFDARFPGKIGRFRAGSDIVIMRWTESVTHWIHPLSVCLRANVWTVEALPMVRWNDGDRSAFEARKRDETLAVREQVRAADGTVFADVEGWFWQALTGRTCGLWLALSVASLGRD